MQWPLSSSPSPLSLYHSVTNPSRDQKQNSNGVISRGPSPNRGASVPDTNTKAIPDQASKREWQKKRGIDPSKHVRIVKLSHMRYQHPDLNKITTFLRGEFLRSRVPCFQWC